MVKRLRPFTRAKRAQRVAKIETAVASSGSLKARLHDDLVRIYGPALRISFGQSPVLIGGLRITVGSDLYDGSVRGALAALEDTYRVEQKSSRNSLRFLRALALVGWNRTSATA